MISASVDIRHHNLPGCNLRSNGENSKVRHLTILICLHLNLLYRRKIQFLNHATFAASSMSWSNLESVTGTGRENENVAELLFVHNNTLAWKLWPECWQFGQSDPLARDTLAGETVRPVSLWLVPLWPEQESRREGWTDARSAVGFCLGSGLFGSYNSD